MINKAILVGNVGQDPEVKHLDSDRTVATFSLATSETYKNQSGELVKNTEWHNIVVWRGLAKVVEQYVKKGMTLAIEGKIVTESYEKDGQRRYTTKIVASELRMIGGKSEGSQQTQGVQDNQQGTGFVDDVDDSDLPF